MGTKIFLRKVGKSRSDVTSETFQTRHTAESHGEQTQNCVPNEEPNFRTERRVGIRGKQHWMPGDMAGGLATVMMLLRYAVQAPEDK
jgi:hypothetical protein